MADRVVRRAAAAKINLFLRVLRRRDDGYHDLETLVVPTSLADVVTARPAAGIRVAVSGAPELTAAVPSDDRNLVAVAARELAERCGARSGAHVEVEKRIPVAAGLGGGSADAAAALWALNDLWGCRLDAVTLAEVGARVGSDVPALVFGRPVQVRGRGDLVRPFPVPGRLWWVLVPQPFEVRTADAYRWWDEDGGMSGPDPGPLLEAVARGARAEEVAPHLFNDLEDPVVRRVPEVAGARERLRSAGAVATLLCGSGPTVVGLVAPEDARAVTARVPGAIAVSAPP